MAARACSVGLISDTHGLLRPQAAAALAGSDCIIHAGDIGGAEILEQLARIAPVTVVRGNNDQVPWAAHLRDTEVLRVAGVDLYVIHDLGELDIAAAGAARAVISGHSHKPGQALRDGVLYVNPGSAGPRRFRLPVSVGRLHVAAGKVEAELITLEV